MYPNAYHKPDDKWWNGYVGQDTVVIDDFAGGHLTFTSLKLVLDKGPFTCQIKGSHVQLEASTFVITSNYHPKYWYASTVLGDHGEAAICRRITRLIEFESPGVYVEHVDHKAWLADDNNAWKYK